MRNEMVTRFEIEAAQPVFRALSDPTRRAILNLLAERSLAVCDIAAQFKISRPAISRHLRVLREADLVREQAQGRTRLYEFHRTPLEEVRDWLNAFWAARLDALKRMAEGESHEPREPDRH